MTYEHFAAYRAGLVRDYAPCNNQEHMMVDEVASSWRRLVEARHRERLFFDLQRHYQQKLAETGGEQAFHRDGAEVIMWLKAPHQAFNQILRAVRDADLAFDRAVRRLEAVIDRRLRRAMRMKQPRRTTEYDGFSAAAAWQTLETPISAAWNGRPYPPKSDTIPHSPEPAQPGAPVLRTPACGEPLPRTCPPDSTQSVTFSELQPPPGKPRAA